MRKTFIHVSHGCFVFVNIRREILGSNISEDDDFLTFGQDTEVLALVGYNSTLTPQKEKSKKQAKREKSG